MIMHRARSIGGAIWPLMLKRDVDISSVSALGTLNVGVMCPWVKAMCQWWGKGGGAEVNYACGSYRCVLGEVLLWYTYSAGMVKVSDVWNY